MSAPITGGESVKPVYNLTDQDMADVKRLLDSGMGREGPPPDGAFSAITSLRRGSVAAKAAHYREWVAAARDAMFSSNPRVQREWRDANAAFTRRVHASSPGASSVHTDTALSTMSLQYANEEFIGELLCPPCLVPKKSDVYYKYGKADRLTPSADDAIAENGEAQEVVESRTTGSYACVDRGNKNSIAANAVANQDAPLNELFDLTEALVEHRALARERRLATVMTTAANYATANKETLAGADQWNAAGGGNPIKKIQDATAALFRGRAPAMTKAFSDLNIYHVLSRHPDILGLFQYSGTAVGLATPKMIAGFFGLDDYLVGKARYNSAAEGASASYDRIWGDYFGICRCVNRATLRSAGFCMNLRWTMPGVPGANQGILTQQWFDPTKGLGGAYFAKVGESEHAIVQTDDCGFLYSDVLA